MKFRYTTDRLYLRTLDERSADKILEFYNAGKDVFSRVESEKPSSFYTLSYQATLASMEFKSFLDGTYMRYYLFDITEPDTIIGTVSPCLIIPALSVINCCRAAAKKDMPQRQYPFLPDVFLRSIKYTA